MSTEAMKLALEALKELVAQTEIGLFAVKHDHVAMQNARQAITALREALAQPQQDHFDPLDYIDPETGEPFNPVDQSAWSLVGGRFDGGNAMDEAEVAKNELYQMVAEALAQPQQEIADIAALVDGMEVSIDVSTGDHDSGNRLFGSVTLVQENQGSKHGLILLVQDPEANFKTAAPKPAQRTWVGLTDEEIETVWRSVQANDFHDCVKPFARAIEAAHGIKGDA